MEPKVLLRSPRLMPEDTFSVNEKRKQLQKQLPVSVFLFILSVAGAIAAIVLRSYDHRGPALVCAITHSIIAALSVATIFWTLLWMRKLALCSIASNENSETGLSRIIFILSIIGFFAVLCFTIILSSNHQFVADYYQAEKGDSGLKDYMNSYNNIKVALIMLSVLTLPFIAFTTYTGYALTGTVSTVRLTLYIVGFIQIGLILYLIYLCRATLNLSSIYSMKKIINFWAVKLLLSIAIFSIFLTILAFFANLKRMIRVLVFIGFFSLLLLFICTAVEGIIYKNITQIKLSYSSNCNESIKNVPDSVLQSEGCKEKYLEIEKGPFLSCPKQEQTIVWEPEGKLSILNKKNKVACLNTNCCGVSSMLYRSWLSRLVSTNICFLAASFCLISCCFFLSNKLGASRTLSQLSELILVVATIILIVSALAFIFCERHTTSNEKVQILSGTQVLQGNNSLKLVPSQYESLERYSKLAEYDSSLRCYKVNEIREKNMYFAKIDEDKCKNSERRQNRQVCNDGLQIIIMLKKATYRLPADLNSKHLRFYDPGLYQKIFPNLKQPEASFIGFEGMPEYINELIDKKLEICPINLPQNIEIYIFEKQGPLKPFVTSSPAMKKSSKTSLSYIPATSLVSETDKTSTLRENPFPIKEHKNLNASIQIKVDWASQNSQANLNQMIFSEVEILTKNILNNASVPDMKVSLTKGMKNCKKSDFIKDDVFMSFKMNATGEKSLYHVPHGKYTIYLEKEGYHISCTNIDIYTKKKTRVFAYVLPRLSPGQVAVVVSHGGYLDLNLFSSFDILDKEECIVGYMGRSCGGVSFYSVENKNYIAQAIIIENISKTQYLFYISEHINNITKSKRDLDFKDFGSEINDEFLSADATFKIYTSELDFPAEQKTSIPLPSKDWNMIRSDPRLAYLYVCFNGEKSLVAKPIDKFWTQSIWDEKRSLPGRKNDGDMFPKAKICEGF